MIVGGWEVRVGVIGEFGDIAVEMAIEKKFR